MVFARILERIIPKKIMNLTIWSLCICSILILCIESVLLILKKLANITITLTFRKPMRINVNVLITKLFASSKIFMTNE